MMANELLEHTAGACGEPEPLGDHARARGAEHVVLEEADAAVDQPARLRLGDVVKERGELEHLASPHAAPELLGHVRRELVAERPQLAQPLHQRVGSLDRPERVLEHREPMGRRLGRSPHRFHLGHDHAEQTERVQAPQGATGARQREHRQQLVTDSLGGDAGQPRRGGADRLHRGRGQPKSQRGFEPDAAQRAKGILGEDTRRVDAKSASPEIGEPPGRVDHLGAPPPQELAHRHRQRVHGEVARRQIVFQGRRPPVRHVEAHPAREDPRGAAIRIERHERAAEPLSHPARDVERARFDRDVQIGRRRPPSSRELRVTDRAADEHRGARAAGGRLHGAEQRPGGRCEVLELEDGGTHDTSAPEPAALNAGHAAIRARCLELRSGTRRSRRSSRCRGA